MRLAIGMRRPKNPVPGRDVAGTVVEVGAAVTRFAVGDEVYGVAPGSFAEYAVATRDQARTQAGQPLLRPGRRRPGLGWHRPAGARSTSAGSRPASPSWSPAPPAASAATRSSSPRRSAPRSPACAAPPRPTYVPRLAPTTSSTTPATTSPTAPAATTSCSTSPATPRAPPARALNPAGRPSSSAARTPAPSPGWAGRCAACCLSPFAEQRLVLLATKERGRRLRAARPPHRGRPD